MRPWTAAEVEALTERSLGFNGATALRPWTAVRPAEIAEPERVLQWGHGLAAVDGPKPPARAASREPASMGPRPCGRGRQYLWLGNRTVSGLQWGHGLAAVDGAGRGPSAIACLGFNGATALRPWTACSRRPARRAGACFNGATALRPWTALDRVRGGCAEYVLQWGHGLAAVDGTAPACAPLISSGFNGATALRPWTAYVGAFVGHNDELQWDHGLAAVDGGREGAALAPRGCASMGPRPCGRGRSPGRGSARRPSRASMGPRPCGRGRNTV